MTHCGPLQPEPFSDLVQAQAGNSKFSIIIRDVNANTGNGLISFEDLDLAL